MYKTSKINGSRKNTKEIRYSMRCLLSSLFGINVKVLRSHFSSVVQHINIRKYFLFVVDKNVRIVKYTN